MRLIRKGSTSQTVYFSVNDSASTTGGKKTGIAFNSSGIVASYTRNGAARTAITLATQTASGAWSSGGWVEVDSTNEPGLYRFDVPDAAFASGVDSVVVQVRGVTGMVDAVEEVQLTAVDLQDATAFGLSRIDAAVSSRMATFTLPTNFSSLAIDASGRVTVGAIINGAIAAATFAANALDAAWSTATRVLTAGTNIALAKGTGVTGFNDVSTTQVENAVLDATASSHNTAGTIGNKINAAASAGDPLGNTVPGAYAVNTAGRRIGDYLDAAVSSRPSGTDYTTARAAKLDNLDVAVSSRASGSVGGVVGSGSRSEPVTVTRPDGTTPIEGVAVWVSTDAAGTNVVAGTLYTDTLGRINGTVGFMLDPGNYYLWRQHGSWTFTNPTTFTVT